MLQYCSTAHKQIKLNRVSYFRLFFFLCVPYFQRIFGHNIFFIIICDMVTVFALCTDNPLLICEVSFGSP